MHFILTILLLLKVPILTYETSCSVLIKMCVKMLFKTGYLLQIKALKNEKPELFVFQ
jgi:hypothetical protein